MGVRSIVPRQVWDSVKYGRSTQAGRGRLSVGNWIPKMSTPSGTDCGDLVDHAPRGRKARADLGVCTRSDRAPIPRSELVKYGPNRSVMLPDLPDTSGSFLGKYVCFQEISENNTDKS